MDSTGRFCLAGLLLALALAGLLGPFASSDPDGLETVAEHHFPERMEAAAAWRFAPVPDYQFPGVDSQIVGTALAGVAGTLLLFGATWGLARLLAQRGNGDE